MAITINESNNAEIKVVLELEFNGLEEVKVSGVKMKSASATRTIMELIDIPQAIVVLGQKTIDQQGAFDLTTIVRNMSGVNFNGNYSGAGSYQFFNARHNLLLCRNASFLGVGRRRLFTAPLSLGRNLQGGRSERHAFYAELVL